MSESSPSEQRARVKGIERGAYWFGIVGRLSVFWGAVCLIAGLAMAFLDVPGSHFAAVGAGRNLVGTGATPAGVSLLSQSVSSLVYGWLFLLWRDVLETIQSLIQEIGEIV